MTLSSTNTLTNVLICMFSAKALEGYIGVKLHWQNSIFPETRPHDNWRWPLALYQLSVELPHRCFYECILLWWRMPIQRTLLTDKNWFLEWVREAGHGPKTALLQHHMKEIRNTWKNSVETWRNQMFNVGQRKIKHGFTIKLRLKGLQFARQNCVFIGWLCCN